MRHWINLRAILGASLAVGLLVSLACGSSEEDTPTPRAVPTATATPFSAVPSPAASPTPTETADKAVYGGTVRIATGNVRSLDIGTIAGNPSEYNAMQQWMSQLVRVSIADRVTVEGDLAESWSVSGDGTAYTFKLRDDLIDHAGNKWTADDVAYAVWKIIARPLNDPLRRILCWEAGAAEADPNGPAPGTAVEVTGELEFVVRTSDPIGWYMACMAQHFSLIGPGDGYRKIVAEGEFRELSPEGGELIGTGPFKVAEYVRGNRIAFERHDQFFREGLPYIDRIEYAHVTEVVTEIAAIRSRRADGYLFGECCAPQYSDVAPLKASMGVELIVPQAFAYGTGSFIANLQRPPLGPQDDPTAKKIRNAIQLYIDRQLHNDLGYDGLAIQIFFYWCGFEWIYSCDEWKELPGFAEDPDKKAVEQAEAIAIMESLGYGPDNMLELVLLAGTGAGQRRTEVLLEELKGMYIDGQLRIPPAGESVYEDQFAGRFDLADDVSGYGLLDPIIFDTNKYLPLEMGSENYGRWESQEWMDLYKRQLPMMDLEARGAVYREMIDILMEDLPQFTMNRLQPLHPYNARVKGFTPKTIHASSASLESVWIGEATGSPEQLATDVFYTGKY